MKVLFLIRALTYGGAERELVVLAKAMHERGRRVVVVVYYRGGPLERELLEAGVPIRSLGKRGRWDIVRFAFRLIRVVGIERPDVVFSFLADLPTLILKPIYPSLLIVWTIQGSFMDMAVYDWLMQFSFKMTCWFSRFADAIIANSNAGRQYYIALGYPEAKTVVIPNGIDTERFQPDSDARRRVRMEWNVGDHELLVGCVARLDPMKDHPNFLMAAAALVREYHAVRFICVGDGPSSYRASLQALSKKLGLADHIMWADSRADVSSIYNALDLLVSSSAFGEGMSNVICESMACGVPCVVTNVGDSAWIVGELGEVVPPKDPVALKEAIQRLLNHKPYDLIEIRKRIIDHLSIPDLVTNTEQVLDGLLDGSRSKLMTDRSCASAPITRRPIK